MAARLAIFAVTWMLAGCGGAFAQTSTVLNLSHDLVAKGIASQNMVPDSPGLDARPLFQAGITYASKNHIPTVTADRGSYYLITQNSGFQHAILNGITNVTIDLQHSDLYFMNRNIIGIQLINCTNVTLKNFTTDYLQLPFTQVTVTSVNSTTRTITFTPLPSYPLPSALNSYTPPSGYADDGFYAFDFRGGEELSGTGRMGITAPLNDSSVQITDSSPWAQSVYVANIEAGDTLVITRRSGLATIIAAECTGLTIQNVSVYASGFVGVLTSYGSGITIDHVQVIPRPGTDRLIATNTGGIRLAHAGANNVMSNNTVRRGCDDALAIGGEWSAIVNAPNSGATVQVSRLDTSALPVGTSFDFIDISNATVIGTAVVVSESPAPAQQTGAAGELITLTLNHAINGLQKNFGVTPSDPNLRGGGTIISGNVVEEEVFARGIYLSGVSNITVTDNLVVATNQSGILVEMTDALNYSFKAGPSSGLTIKNNIVDSAFAFGIPSNPLLEVAAAINVVADDENSAWVSTTPFSNISITGNFVSNSIRSGIRMENVAAGQITGNTILNYGTSPAEFVYAVPACCETTAQVEADFKQPIVVAASTAVTNSNNTITGPWVVSVSEADSGYRLAPESIAVAYGQNFAPSLVTSGVQPLPPSIEGFTVAVKDSAGVSRPAGLYYISPSAIAYVVPKGTASGVATLTVGGTVSAALIAPVAPGILTANQTGSGVALAGALRISADGNQVPVPVYQCGSAGCTSVPIDLGAPTDSIVIVLYGTGIRGNSGLTNVVAQIGGVPAQVAYAKEQSTYDGLDQVNIYLPRSLAGAGEVPVVLTVDGITANVVTVNVK